MWDRFTSHNEGRDDLYGDLYGMTFQMFGDLESLQELSFFDRDGNSIDFERWSFLTKEGGNDYCLVSKSMNDEMYVQTIWFGISQDAQEPQATFATILLHNPYNPHIDDVMYSNNEEQAAINHRYKWMSAEFFNGDVGRFRLRIRRSRLGQRFFQRRIERDKDYKKHQESSL